MCPVFHLFFFLYEVSLDALLGVDLELVVVEWNLPTKIKVPEHKFSALTVRDYSNEYLYLTFLWELLHLDAEIIWVPNKPLLILNVVQDTLVHICVCQLLWVESLSMNFDNEWSITVVYHKLEKVNVPVILKTIQGIWVGFLEMRDGLRGLIFLNFLGFSKVFLTLL